jgi:hypothetical protein
MRHAYTLALVIPVAMSICFAGVSSSLERADFESGAHRSWEGPWGGGMGCGAGGGSFVRAGSNSFVRSGRTAARLDAWNTQPDPCTAWSCLRQRVRCVPGSQMKASVWLYSSSMLAPLAETGATVQLRVEYFADDDGEQIIPTHVDLSKPFGPSAGSAPDTWEMVFVSDRIPEGARSLGLSIVLMTQGAGTNVQSVWVDDAQLELRVPGRANQPVPRGKVEPPDFPWWKQLFGP